MNMPLLIIAPGVLLPGRLNFPAHLRWGSPSKKPNVDRLAEIERILGEFT